MLSACSPRTNCCLNQVRQGGQGSWLRAARGTGRFQDIRLTLFLL